MLITLSVWQVLGIVLAWFILKWLFRYITIFLIIKVATVVVNEVKKKGEEKLNGLKSNLEKFNSKNDSNGNL